MKVSLPKGTGAITFSLPAEKMLAVLQGRAVPALTHDRVLDIIDKGLRTSTPATISKQTVAVIIPDDTRLWARGDLFVPRIIQTLSELGVDFDRITIIIALGTHKEAPPETFAELAGAWSCRKVAIINSAGLDSKRLVRIGTTVKGSPLFVTREAWQADHIIIFGGVLHHMLAGYGGGRKYIFPGIAGEVSIRHNHSLAIQKNGQLHPRVRQAVLQGNPVHEDMVDGARLFLKDKTASYVAIAANGSQEIFHAAVGDVHDTFAEGCRKLDEACCLDVPCPGDFVLFSAGGFRTDHQLYQATKALFNAVNVVKPGGNILFVAECGQGDGNPVFARLLREFKQQPTQLGRRLVSDFDMPSFVAFRVIDILTRFRVTLISGLPETITRELGFDYTHSIDRLIKDLPGRGYVIPYAENILPLVKTG